MLGPQQSPREAAVHITYLRIKKKKKKWLHGLKKEYGETRVVFGDESVRRARETPVL